MLLRNVLSAVLPAIMAVACSQGLYADVVTHVETFEGLNNPAGWQMGTQDFLDPTGGHPNEFLHNTFLNTPGPAPRTEPGVESEFTSDFRARGVVSMGIDLKTFISGPPGMPEFPLTILLTNDQGSPSNENDDCWAYFIGEETTPDGFVPCFGGVGCDGWQPFELAIPSQETTLPAGWEAIGSCGEGDAGWNAVITNVSMVEFHFGDPTVPGIFLLWELGVDNPRISWELSCPPPDLNGDCTVGAADLAMLLAAWGPCGDPGNCPADLNGDGTVGAADLAVLLASWS